MSHTLPFNEANGMTTLQKFRRILVPVVGEENDRLALELACDLASSNRAQVWVISVVEVRRSLPLDADVSEDVARASAALEQAEELCHEAIQDVETEILQARLAGPAIIDEAESREADLIIIGLPYRLHFRGFDLGDTAAYVLKNARCPVWICRARRPLQNGP